MSRISRTEFLSGLSEWIGHEGPDLPGGAAHPATGARSGLRGADFVRTARRAVEDGLDRPTFGVSDLARALSLSPRQLQRRIQDSTGCSPCQFIRTIRLERARSLIEDGRQSVGDAAQAVRISSLSYFARRFREEFGLNPSEFVMNPDSTT
jgi:AraC-like DNA-binding protein